MPLFLDCYRTEASLNKILKHSLKIMISSVDNMKILISKLEGSNEKRAFIIDVDKEQEELSGPGKSTRARKRKLPVTAQLDESEDLKKDDQAQGQCG